MLQEAEKDVSRFWYMTIHLGNEDVNFKLDTGLEVNLIQPIDSYEAN